MAGEVETLLKRLVNGVTQVLKEVRRPQHRGPTVDFYQPKGGQLQFSVAPPRYRDAEINANYPNDAGIRWASKMGAVFIEAAPPDPNSDGRLDWSNKKIVFALSDKDIGALLWGLACKDDRISVIHAPDEDNRQNSKTFAISKGKDNPRTKQPTWNLSLTEKKDGNENRVSVFVGGPDIMRLKVLLEQSLPFILGAHKT